MTTQRLAIPSRPVLRPGSRSLPWPRPSCLGAASVAALLLLVPLAARCNPHGGVVVRGDAEITSGPGEVVVHQKGSKTVVNWNGFSVEDGEVTRFKQPDKHAIALNRVVGPDPSRIDGRVQADGHVWLVNKNGVTVGPKGRVDATGFLATTADIDDDDFMAGNHRFARPSSNPDARVVNQGTISLADQGLGALVAPHARNDGVIEGRMAKVVIGGAETFTLDLYGDGLIQFDATSKVKQRPAGVLALAENTGEIRADGGTVLITADAAAGIVENVINMSGRVQARSFAAAPGRIILRGGDEGVVRVTGELDASGAEPGAAGGRIDVRGKRVLLTGNARLDASGPAGGGEVLVGGDQSGGGPGSNAQDTVVMPGARVAADATAAGKGGRVIVYADRVAKVYGHLSARGGPQSGDGGFIETSGKASLEVGGVPDVGASAGARGTWLIDPWDLQVTYDQSNFHVTQASPFEPTAAGAVLSKYVLEDALGLGNVTIATALGPPGGELGNITFDALVNGLQSSLSNLTIHAAGGVTFNQPLLISGALIVTAQGGDIVETAAGLLQANDSSFTAVGHAIRLGGGNHLLGAVSLNNSGANDVVLGNTFGVMLGASQIGGNLDVMTDSTIDQSEPLTVGGAARFSAVGPITLNHLGNAFSGAVSLAAGGIGGGSVPGAALTTLANGAPLQLGTITVDGDLGVMAAGAISGSQTLTVTGAASFDTLDASGAGAPITLTAPDSTFGSLSARSRAYDEGVVPRGGDITITESGTMDLVELVTTGTATLSAGALNGLANIAPGLTSLDLTLTAAGIDLPALNLPGRLSVQAAGPIGLSGPLSAGGALRLQAAGLISLNAPISGATVELGGGGGIYAGSGGRVIAQSNLTALAAGGDILMADGSLWQAGGPVYVQAQGSVYLGRIEAGANPLSVVAAGGAIVDNTAGEGPGQENLVAADLSLRAAAAIGAPGAGAVDIAAARLDAAAGGALYVAASGALQLGSQAAVQAGGPLDLSAVGPLTVARAVSVGGSGDLVLTTTGPASDLLLGADLSTALGNLELISGASILRTGPAVLRNTVDERGTVSLCAAEVIGSAAVPLFLDAAVVAARSQGRNGNGGIYLTQVDGLQGNLTIGTTPCPCASPGVSTMDGNIVVLTLGQGQAPNYGRLDVQAPVRVYGRGDIWLQTMGTESDIDVAVRPETGNGTVTIKPGRRWTGLDSALGGLGEGGFSRQFVTVNWGTMQSFWAALSPTLAPELPRVAALVTADDYAVPDFGDLDESEFLFMSGGNEDLWGPSVESEEERRRGEDGAGGGAR